VEQIEDERTSDMLASVRREISGGTSLATALASHPRVFDSFYVSTIRVGESSGSLPLVFERLEEHLQKRLDIRNSIITSMIYPAIVTVMAFNAVIFIMTWVLPRFIVIFERNRVELPLPSRILMKTSGFMVNNWYWLIGALAGLIALAYWGIPKMRDNGMIQAALMKVPITRNLVVTLQTGLLFRTLGTQLSTGVPLLEGLQVTRDATKNREFRELLESVIRAVTQGEELSAPFRRSDLLEPAVKQMIMTGEQSGSLAVILLTLSDHLDKKADKQLKRLTAVLEPVLLLGMGVMIGFIAVATLFPLFKLTSAVHGGH
jgi:type IV pilus assembly protein PilC